MSMVTLNTGSARRRVAKSPKAPAAKPIKVSVYLSPESAERLGIHGVKTRLTQSAIVDRLIQDNLKRFVVQDREKEKFAAQADSPAPDTTDIDPQSN